MKKSKSMTVTRRLAPLIERVRALVHSARRAAAANVNTLQVITNFEIGRLIVEHEQAGDARAVYGKETIRVLAANLTAEFGRGFSKANLEYMRRFYLVWQDRSVQIAQKASGQLIPISAKPSRKFANPFPLSWSHYVVLLGVKDAAERSFYEIESAQSSWSVPELKRQFDSGLYERLALSRNKKGVRELARKGQIVETPRDILKSPLVLEFLGLDEKPVYSESELETAIIGKLQHFLLELGKGFLFEARQKRFTFGADHFFVDLVFYNRLLRCYVLLDLKIGKLTHQDIGQMQMYVNHYDRRVRCPDERPTVGIILCKKKHDAMVEITLPRKANIFASEYKLYLPSKEDLRRLILDLAVRGKLVEQDPSDEPAAELLKRIQAEKARLMQVGDIRKEKSVPPLTEEKLPFSIPKNWYWSQLAEVGVLNPRNTAVDELPASFVPMPLISADYGVANKHEVRPWGEIKSGYTHFAEGDVALAKITPCFENGKSTVFRDLTGGIGAGTTELHVVRPVIICADYVLCSEDFRNHVSCALV